MQRLILSRKGFDSSAGGVPSPIFPDGRIISLPIPDRRTNLRYKDIDVWSYNLGTIVDDLTRGKVRPDWNLHLDPDLNPNHLIRHEDWRPTFGQVGAAQGHLENQKVSAGDLFLFFGLFQEVEGKKGRWKFLRNTTPKHLIWGWLQIGKIVKVDDIKDQLDWAKYHPHFNRPEDKSNTLYLSSRYLHIIPGISTGTIPGGAGVFEHFSEQRQLTAPEAPNSTLWELPAWFFPESKQALTYHGKMDRWQRKEENVLLKSASRGQEFILQTEHYPEAKSWLNEIGLTLPGSK